MENNTHKVNPHLDAKSLIIGVLLTLCIVLAMGATDDKRVPASRYQCCAAGGDELGVFVIDTETGHTWKLSHTRMYDLGTPQLPISRRKDITPYVN